MRLRGCPVTTCASSIGIVAASGTIPLAWKKSSSRNSHSNLSEPLRAGAEARCFLKMFARFAIMTQRPVDFIETDVSGDARETIAQRLVFLAHGDDLIEKFERAVKLPFSKQFHRPRK